MKLIKIFILLIQIVNQISSQNHSIIQNRHWLVSCLSCSNYLRFCFNCYGVPQCTDCLTSIRPECSYCINDIYLDDKLEIINGKKYLICDKSSDLHTKICHLYCRGMYFETGICQRFKTKPICRCKFSKTNSSQTVQFTATAILQTNLTTSFFNKSLPTKSASSSITTTTKSIPTTSVLSSTTTKIKSIPSTTNISITTTQESCENFDPITKLLYNQKKEINSLIVLTNKDLVTASADNTLHVWETSTYTLKRKLSYTYGFWSLIELTKSTFAGGSISGEILIWNTTNWDVQYKFVAHSAGVEYMLKWNNKYLITCSQDKLIKIWNPNTFDLIRTLEKHSDHVNYLLELKNGDLASCSDDKTIIIWKRDNFSVIHTLTNHSGKVDSLALSKNDDLISCDREGNIIIWNKINFSIKKSIRVNSGVYSLLVLSNGNVVTGLWDGTNKIWNSNDWSLIRSFGNQTRLSQRFALLPSGDIANGYNDGKLIIWNKCLFE